MQFIMGGMYLRPVPPAGFIDDFSTDTISTYALSAGYMGWGYSTTYVTYDATGQKMDITIPEGNYGIAVAKDFGVSAQSGVFAIDVTEISDTRDDGWCEFVLSDAVGTNQIGFTVSNAYGSSIHKVVNDVEVESKTISSPVIGTKYSISVDFSPSTTTITGLGTNTLDLNTTAIDISKLTMQAHRANFYIDNITFTPT